jgi:RNA polymerase sigma-70 factor (ECF subfamily)
MSKLTAGAGERAAASDEALMEAYARCGDSTAFEQLYDRWSDRLFGYLARAMDPATAEELFQTLWMRLHAARQSYGSGRAVAPWIFAIAANLRREEWRRRFRHPEEPHAVPPPSGAGASASAEEEALAVERDRVVRKALTALPEAQRDVIELHRFEHLSFPEIAEALGEGVEAVKSRAFRGYKALKVLLAEMRP